MKPLIILLSAFALCLGATYIMQKPNINVSGRIAMSLMLLFTAIGHFKFTEGMAMMLPAFVPARKQIVIATGIIEIFAAAGLLIPFAIKLTGILLVIFFLLILPANIYAAFKKVNLEEANYSGSGTRYLWLRIPMQVLFVFWIYFFALK